jgi:hypothetical protein
MFHDFGSLGQVGCNLETWHRCGNSLGFPAMGVAWARGKRLELAGAALHPEQDAGLAAAPKNLGLRGHQVGPAKHPGGDSGGRDHAQEVAATDPAAGGDSHLASAPHPVCHHEHLDLNGDA